MDEVVVAAGPRREIAERQTSTVPITLIRSPCNMKIRRTWPGSTPKLIITAMSRVFSITIMVSAIRMLSAATITMSPITMNVTTCSSLRARNSSRFWSVQFGGHVAWACGLLNGAGNLRRVVQIVDFEADHRKQVGLIEEALRVGEAQKAHFGVVLVKAGVKSPRNAKGHVLRDEPPIGVNSPCGLTTMTESPATAPIVSARSLPRTIGGSSLL